MPIRCLIHTEVSSISRMPLFCFVSLAHLVTSWVFECMSVSVVQKKTILNLNVNSELFFSR